MHADPGRRIVIESMFPHITNQHVISMPCVAKQSQSHRVKLVPSWPSIPLEVLMLEAGVKSLKTPAYVHRLLSRKNGEADLKFKQQSTPSETAFC